MTKELLRRRRRRYKRLEFDKAPNPGGGSRSIPPTPTGPASYFGGAFFGREYYGKEFFG